MHPTTSDDRYDEVPPTRPRRKPPWRLVAGVVLGVIVIVGIFAVCFPTQFKHQLDISTARQPTPYTQLFFSDPQALPAKLDVGHRSEFSFSVVNDQGRSSTYHYTVTVTRAKDVSVASSGSLTLGDQQTATQTVSVKPAVAKATYLVTVTLDGTPDVIHFYAKTS